MNADAAAAAMTRIARAARIPGRLTAPLPASLVAPRGAALTAGTSADPLLDAALSARPPSAANATEAPSHPSHHGGDRWPVTATHRRPLVAMPSPPGNAVVATAVRETSTRRRHEPGPMDAGGAAVTAEGGASPSRSALRTPPPDPRLPALPQGVAPPPVSAAPTLADRRQQHAVTIARDPAVAEVLGRLVAAASGAPASGSWSGPLTVGPASASAGVVAAPSGRAAVEPRAVAADLVAVDRGVGTWSSPPAADGASPLSVDAPSGLGALAAWWEREAVATGSAGGAADAGLAPASAPRAGMPFVDLAEAPTTTDGAGVASLACVVAVDPLLTFRDVLEQVLSDEALADGLEVV